MQNVVVGIIVAASFIGLTLVALRSKWMGTGAIWFQLAIGTIIGALAAAIAVSIRADLVPDNVEAIIAAGVVVLAAVGLIAIVVDQQSR